MHKPQDIMLFFQSLMEASHAAHMFVEKVILSESDITMIQFGILKQLIARGGIVDTMTELWCDHHTTRGNLSGVIDRMIDAGLVSRSESVHDRRRKQISITDVGRSRFEDVEKLMREHIPLFIEKTKNLPIKEVTQTLIMIRDLNMAGIENKSASSHL